MMGFVTPSMNMNPLRYQNQYKNEAKKKGRILIEFTVQTLTSKM